MQAAGRTFPRAPRTSHRLPRVALLGTVGLALAVPHTSIAPPVAFGANAWAAIPKRDADGFPALLANNLKFQRSHHA
jgi:hypothetical protein